MQDLTLFDSLVQQTRGGFSFYETNPLAAETILCFHGLFGELSNFEHVFNYFGEKYNVVLLELPIYTLPRKEITVGNLAQHAVDFLQEMQYERVHGIGNSLGGHVGILTYLLEPSLMNSLTLTGSSGLFESSFGNAFPKRGDKVWLKNKIGETFYDPAMVTDNLVNEVYAIVNDRNRALRVVATAKSATRENLASRLHEVNCPVLLVWGEDDTITPLDKAGMQFHKLLPQSTMQVFAKCKHVCMMEHPEKFNQVFETFLESLLVQAA